jgi:putative copper export protein
VRDLYLVSVYLHLLCTAIWIGGMLFLVLVVVPVLRRPELRAQAPALFAITGLRFRSVGWATLIALVATGLVQLAWRLGGLSALGDATWWSLPFGRILGIKLTLVALSLSIAAVHDFWIGPRASALLEHESGSPRAERWRAGASWLGRINLLLGLGIVALAVVLVRGLD